MVCYICGKPASFQCPVCGRYVCNEHTHSTVGIEYLYDWLTRDRRVRRVDNLPLYLCDSCFKEATAYSNRQVQNDNYRTHYCDFHKCYHDDNYLKSQSLYLIGNAIVNCGKCGKQVCIDSTIRSETIEFEGYDPTERSYEGESLEKVWLKVTKYLCPICGNIIFLSVEIYRKTFEKRWFMPDEYKYKKTVMIRPGGEKFNEFLKHF
jgi:hypothetical protein